MVVAAVLPRAELVGAGCVFTVGGGAELDVPFLVLVDFSSCMVEVLIFNRNMRHEILVVGVPVLLGQECTCILSVSLVAHTWLAEVVHAYLVACSKEVHRCKVGNSCAEAVPGGLNFSSIV